MGRERERRSRVTKRERVTIRRVFRKREVGRKEKVEWGGGRGDRGGRMSGEKNRNGRSATGRRGSRRNNSRCKSMADKGGSVPRGKGRVAFVGSRSTRKEDRDPEIREYSTRERWVFVPRKCLVQELFICRVSTKIFALKWVLRFLPQSSILLLPQPSNPPIFCPCLKVALQRRPVP